MKNSGKKLIIISFVLALISAITVYSYLASLKKPVETVKEITILVAADTIPARTLVDSKMIKEIKVPESTVFNEYLKVSADIVGKYTKNAVLKNQGFLTENLVKASDNELIMRVPSGHRAVSINVTASSAVTGLIKVGDYVDIAAVLKNTGDAQQAAGGQPGVQQDSGGGTVRVIMQNIMILAIDKQINRTAAAKESDEVGTAPGAFLVTLSIPAADLEKFLLAETTASLKLALRPISDEAPINPGNPSLKDLLIMNSVGPKIVETGKPEAAGVSGSTPPGSTTNGGTTSSSTSNNSTSNSTPTNGSSAGSAGSATGGNVDSSTGTGNGYVNYILRKNDNLRTLSYSFYGTEDKYYLIKEANGITDETTLQIGQIIRIPLK